MDMANLALAGFASRAGYSVEIVAHQVDPSVRDWPSTQVHLVKRPMGSSLLGGPLLAARGKAVGKHVRTANGMVVVNGGNCAWPGVNWVHYVHAAYTSSTG